jgi:hypothetical protein
VRLDYSLLIRASARIIGRALHDPSYNRSIRDHDHYHTPFVFQLSNIAGD